MNGSTQHDEPLAAIAPSGIVSTLKSYFEAPELVPMPQDGRTYTIELGNGNVPYWVPVTPDNYTTG